MYAFLTTNSLDIFLYFTIDHARVINILGESEMSWSNKNNLILV